MSRRARLARYALWQAHDFLVERAAAIVIVLALLLYMSSIGISQATKFSGDARSPEVLHALAPLLMKNLLGSTWLLIGLLAANGISANDRTTGRFRFLFSKPLRVEAFYAQAFAINTGLAIVCLLAAVLVLSTWTAAPAGFVRDAMLIAVCGVGGISGLCFLFSALWRFDWLATMGVWGSVFILDLKYPDAAWLRFLPPTSVVGEQIDRLTARMAVAPGPLIWFVCFGLLCFAAGLVILRRRPLST